MVAVCFALAAGAGRPAIGLEAAPVVLAGLGASLGLSNLFSAALPYPMVRRTGTPMLTAAQGYGGSRFAVVMGTLIGTGIAAAPVIVMVVLTDTTSYAIRIGVLIPAGAIYGFALALAGVRLAAATAVGRLPELSQAALQSAMN